MYGEGKKKVEMKSGLPCLPNLVERGRRLECVGGMRGERRGRGAGEGVYMAHQRQVFAQRRSNDRLGADNVIERQTHAHARKKNSEPGREMRGRKRE